MHWADQGRPIKGDSKMADKRFSSFIVRISEGLFFKGNELSTS